MGAQTHEPSHSLSGSGAGRSVADGRVPARRLAGFAKLQRELEHQAGVVSEHERRERGRQAQRMYREVKEAKRRGR